MFYIQENKISLFTKDALVQYLHYTIDFFFLSTEYRRNTTAKVKFVNILPWSEVVNVRKQTLFPL